MNEENNINSQSATRSPQSDPDYSSFKVLVLGVDERSALTVIRSLGRKGIVVHQGSDNPYSIASHSRYVSRRIELPNAGTEPDLWIKKLIFHLRQTTYDLVIPTADAYLVLVIRHRVELEKLARFAIPDDHGFEYTYKKSKTLELAELLGVPYPKTKRIASAAELETSLSGFRFPLIVKPVSSRVWHNNVRHELDVLLAPDRGKLDFMLEKILSLSPVLLQSFHRGIGVGQEFLMMQGEMIAAFQHERVHEPLGGGGSTYRKSARLDPVLLKYSLDMLQRLSWTGVAMVEYRYDRSTREAVLMEINGRFWGSLPLAVRAGVDFPGLLFDMLVLNKVPQKIPTYRLNLHARNFVNDFDWQKENIRADRSDSFKNTLPLWKVAAEIRHLLMFRERWDTVAFDDMKPARKFIGGYLGEQVAGGWSKLNDGLLKANCRLNLLRMIRNNQRINALLSQNPSVNFICKGNICRSPFAEYYLKSLVEKDGIHHLRIDSVGLIEKVDRSSPGNAIAAAHHFNIDLKPHRSKCISADIVRDFGILFVMDIELYRKVRDKFPEASGKLFFLSEIQPGYPKQVEINDPYGYGLDYFKRIYSQIIFALDEFFITLKKNPAIQFMNRSDATGKKVDQA